VDDDRFVPGSSAEVAVGFLDSTETIFVGEIVAQEPEFLERGPATLTLRGYDLSHRLHRSKKTRTFNDMKDSDIASQIAGDAGLEAEAEDSGTVHPYVFQNNLTDFDFLRSRAAAMGWEVEVEGKSLFFRPPPKDEEGPVKLEWGHNLKSFRPRLSSSGQKSEVVVRGWDPASKKEYVGKASLGDVPAKGGGKLGAEESKEAISDSKHVVTDVPVSSQKEADGMAAALLEEVAMGFLEARARISGDPRVKIGTRVEISGVGARYDGPYYVTRALHVLDRSGYSTELTGLRETTGTEERESEAAAGAAAAEETQEIEIEFVDEDGEAVSDADYEITFSDGTVRTGKLPSSGTFQADNIPAGSVSVKLTLPEDGGGGE
jgi:phage protein D